MLRPVHSLLALSFLAGIAHAQAPATQPKPKQHVSRSDRAHAQYLFMAGGKAVDAKNLPAATTAFNQAAKLDPTHRDYEAASLIARDNYATQIMQQALKAKLEGDTAGFVTKWKAASAQDDRNPLVMEHASEVAEAADPAERTSPEPIDASLAPAITLLPKLGRQSFHLNLPAPELLRQVLTTYGIEPSFDRSVGHERVHFDAEQVTFAQAEQMLRLATDTFSVPLDPSRVLIAHDTKENRSRFERLSLETLYLPGLTQTEINDVSHIAKNLFNAEQATVHESSNTLTLRAPATRIRAFNTVLQELLQGRSETLINVDMYEVQTSRLLNEGAQLPQSTSVFNVTSEVNSLIAGNTSLVQQIISSGLASPGNVAEIALALIVSGQAGSTILSQPFATFGGGLTTEGLTLGGATANLQLNSSITRMLDRVQLRLLDQEEGSVRVGERYPIVTSSYSNLATGSTSIPGITSAGLSNTLQNLGINLSALNSAATASVPQVQYQDIGLKLEATPRVEQGRTIALKLRLQLSSLSGRTLNSNPIINNRQLDQIITVKPGERTVLFSQLSEQESNALLGLPFLSEIPGLTLGTSLNKNETRDSLVIILTPQIVRLSHSSTEGQMVLLPPHS